jgi:hypothetical protein
MIRVNVVNQCHKKKFFVIKKFLLSLTSQLDVVCM